MTAKQFLGEDGFDPDPPLGKPLNNARKTINRTIKDEKILRYAVPIKIEWNQQLQGSYRELVKIIVK